MEDTVREATFGGHDDSLFDSNPNNDPDQSIVGIKMDNLLEEDSRLENSIQGGRLIQNGQDSISQGNREESSNMNFPFPDYSTIHLTMNREQSHATANFLLDQCQGDEQGGKQFKKPSEEENGNDSWCSDDASDQQDERAETTKQRTEQDIRNELFPNRSIIQLAEKESEKVKEFKKDLEDILVKQYQSLESAKRSYREERHKYENILNALSKKKKRPEDYSKRDFYDNKLKNMDIVYGILESDWIRLRQEITALIQNTGSEITRITVDRFRKELSIATSRIESRLPIYAKKKAIVKTLTENRISVIKGKPGCGKSTQIPSILYEQRLVNDSKKMFMITPRRISADQIFKRVMSEMQDSYLDNIRNCGSYCYLISSTECNFKTTCPLVFSTDVEFYKRLVITKEIKPEEISYLVIDEANSKKMYTDLLISVSRKLIKKFSHIKLVFLCTSFNIASMNAYFGRVEQVSEKRNIVEIEEKNYMTEVVYMPLNGDTEKQISDVLQEIEDRLYRSYKKNKRFLRDANILVFLSGATEVRTTYRQFEWLENKEGLMGSRLKELDPKLKTKYKLFMASGSNSLTFDEELFKENNCEDTIKLIFSTKVLETSVTIPNLGFVVDFGKESVYMFDYELGAQRKILRDISKDTAEQREGRVGRTSSGVCFRIYKEDEHDAMESTTESEMQHKNIDLIVMSLVRVVLEMKKSNTDNPFFDKDEYMEEISHQQTMSIVDQLTDMIMRLDLLTTFKEESVKRSLQLFRYMELINDDTLKNGENNDFKIVLALGAEPKFSVALAHAIKRFHKTKKSWILSSMIDVVATNMFNRQLPFIRKDSLKESRDLFDQAKLIACKYGDFAFNYFIFQAKRKFTEKASHLGINEGILKRFDENQRLLQVKTKSLLKLPDNFFKSDSIEHYPEVSEEELFKEIITCLVFGFSTDVSKFINSDLGYYHTQIRKPIRFSQESAFKNRQESMGDGVQSPQYLVMADIIAKDSIYESKFAFEVPIQLLRDKFKRTLEYFDSIKMEKIPSKIYSRTDLCTITLHTLNFRMYYLEQILGDRGYVVDISEKDFSFKIAIKPIDFEETVVKIEKLINFIEKSYLNSSYELGLKDCRINLGNGLAILDLMSSKEGVSCYFFMVPRYIVQKEGKEIPVTNPKDQKPYGPWDFLIEEFDTYFGFSKENLNVWYDTTFTKVNYLVESPFMNLKFTCKTVKDNTRVRELLRKTEQKWRFDEAEKRRPELKFCERHLNKDIHCKPLQLKLLFSLSENNGTAILRANDSASFTEIESVLKQISESPCHTIFGDQLRFKVHNERRSVHDRSIELAGLPKYLDEMTIIQYLQNSSSYLKYSKIKVDMEKELTKHEETKESIERNLRDILNRIIRYEVGDESLENQFNLFVNIPFVRGFKSIRFAEIRLNSTKIKDAIIKCLDKKYYPISNSKHEVSYRIGKQYTHVEDFDRPEFHVKKRVFSKIKTLLDQINQNIEQELKRKYGSESFKYKDEIEKEKSTIKYPEDVKLNSVMDEENLKIMLYKGTDTEIADKVESLLRNYFNGKEIPIQEDYYSYFFGPEGDKFIKELRTQHGYVNIRKIENKSMIVVQELKQDCENKIKEKFVELSKRETRSYHLKLTQSEVLDKKYLESLEKLLKSKFKDINFIPVRGYYGMVIIETSQEHIEKARDTLISFTDDYFHKKQIADSKRITCMACSHTGNLKKLMICKHIYCTGCLQNSFLDQSKQDKLLKVKDINTPFFFCPLKGCNKEIACCDIFNFMPDKLIENVMVNLIEQLHSTKKLPGIVKCSGCQFFNRLDKNEKDETYCFKCHYQIHSKGQ